MKQGPPEDLTTMYRWIFGIANRMGYFGELAEDAAQEGFMGLMQAAESWQPGETSFRTWAGIRVRGAIKDWARTQDHLPRSIRVKYTEEELDTSRWKAPAHWDWDKYENGPETEDLYWSKLVEGSHDQERLAAFMRWWYLQPGCTRNAQITLAMYLDGHTMLDIANVLGVTESRICQIWNGIVLKARDYGRAHGIQRAA